MTTHDWITIVGFVLTFLGFAVLSKQVDDANREQNKDAASIKRRATWSKKRQHKLLKQHKPLKKP